ncbi:hypothetical protein [Streptomyces sp. NBC_00385]|uniref:hypothetical protein n=1 Tax=Streptomyces sp. NBC_00385 TaxID=2975733 RepID=UPI002DDA5ABA|nr:hypothetical protein [Streptomyces sp. NBC_00385]WRZ04285.1 hypothetical protein OG959_13410 [Streptomyces sp. NBC_00385]
MNRRRVTAGIVALLAALVVALLPLPPLTQPARAATGSAVTVTGKKGEFNDFSGLKVTVDQTKDLRAQGVRISWTGARPTQTGFRGDYLQLMQCWGDASAGPTREQCQFGAAQSPSASSGFTNLRQLSVADPAETQYVDNGTFESYVPFRPADGGKPTTGSKDWTYFSSLDTNEEPYAVTHEDGTGEFTFALQTRQEASQLGCGEPVTKNGRVTGRSCWLVIVPRGSTDVDGVPSTTTELRSSPLSTSNWATRMVVPLDFLPVGNTCPADRAERRVIGSELITDAMSSWQPAVCSAAGGAKFAFTQGGEAYARETIAQPRTGAPGLAFTVAPAESGGTAGTPVHAPLAAAGLTIGFFVEMPGSGQLATMKLTPRLVAKMLTSSYQKDVSRARKTIPEHLANNPLSLFHDPEFQQLNPLFANWKATSPAPMSLMVQLESSDTSAMVWDWLRSDREARGFLAGTPDPWGTKINPYFGELGLATDSAVSDFPKADPTRTSLTIGTEELEYGTTEVAPYVQDMHEGALRTRRGNNGATTTAALGGNGTPAKLVNTPPLAGQRMVLAIVDLASAARYGLQTAALRNADGHFVTPTTASVLAGVAAMKDSAVPGVLAPAPGAAKGAAYPLATVAYAAAYPTLPAADRKDYAGLIRYAAGAGQTPGLSPGQLPPGYAPLPAALRAQALAAADRLQDPKTADGGSGAGGSSGAGSTGSSAGSPGGGSGAAGGGSGGTGGAAGAGGGEANPDAAGTPAKAAGPADPKQNVAQSGGLTPSTVLGIIRWVLLGVLVTGGAAALSGPVLLRLSVRKSVRAG